MMKSKNFLFLVLSVVIGTLIMVATVSYLPIPGIPRSDDMNETIELAMHTPNQNTASSSHKEGSGLITEITSEKILDDAINYKKPMIIKIYNNFCPPCKRAQAVWPTLAKQFEGKVAFYNLNVAHQEVTKKGAEKELFSLQRLATPTFIIRNNGKNNNKIEGFGDEKTLLQQINNSFGF